MELVRVTRLSLALVASVAMALVVGPTAGATSGTLVITTDTTLTEDHEGNVLVQADHVALDCAGHQISGSGFAGVRIDFRRGVTVRNCDVSGFFHGIVMLGASETTIENNHAHDNAAAGIVMDQNSTSNALLSNVVEANGHNGIQISFSHGNTIRGNRAESNGGTGGIALGGANDNHVLENATAQNANFGIAVGGARNTVSSNLVTGNGTPGSWEGGIFISSGSDDAVVNGNILSENNEGIRVEGISRAIISGNTADHNRAFGFVVLNSSDVRLVGNDASQNGSIGFLVLRADHGEVIANRSTANGDGFIIESSSHNLLATNSARANDGPGYWIRFGADENVLDGNAATANSEGFVIESSAGTVFTRSTATANGNTGVWIRGSSSSFELRNIVAQRNTHGFVIDRSADGLITQSTANRNGQHGFVLIGAVNLELTGNSANANLGVGFTLFEESFGNRLDGNTANGNGLEGYNVDASNANEFTDNTGNANLVGFWAGNGSISNTFQGNAAHGNRDHDAVDEGGNTWTNNDFGTTSGI
jgi:parallel beta-helix repeat protein